MIEITVRLLTRVSNTMEIAVTLHCAENKYQEKGCTRLVQTQLFSMCSAQWNPWTCNPCIWEARGIPTTWDTQQHNQKEDFIDLCHLAIRGWLFCFLPYSEEMRNEFTEQMCVIWLWGTCESAIDNIMKTLSCKVQQPSPERVKEIQHV